MSEAKKSKNGNRASAVGKGAEEGTFVKHSAANCFELYFDAVKHLNLPLVITRSPLTHYVLVHKYQILCQYLI